MNSVILISKSDILHYGVQGQRWGVRRYQPYPDGYMGDGRYVGEINMRVQRSSSSGSGSSSSPRSTPSPTPIGTPSGRSSGRGRGGSGRAKKTAEVKEKTTKIKDPEQGATIKLGDKGFDMIREDWERDIDATGYSSTKPSEASRMSAIIQDGAIVSTLQDLLNAIRNRR